MSRAMKWMSVILAASLFASSCGSGNSKSNSRQRNTTLSSAAGRLPYSCAQLISDPLPTREDPVATFRLCDDAVGYTVTLAFATVGDPMPVPITRNVEVPINFEDPSKQTTLVVHMADAVKDDELGHGIHTYRVSIDRMDSMLVSPDDPRASDTLIVVDYTMPPPQPLGIYNGTSLRQANTFHLFADYIDEAVQKWSMIAQRTCYETPVLARMSMVQGPVAALGNAQLAAKISRSIDMYISLQQLRYAVFNWGTDLSPVICETGATGYNMFSDGVETNFQPLTGDDVEKSTDVENLAASFAVLHMAEQVANGDCKEDLPFMDHQSAEEFLVQREAVYTRLAKMAANNNYSALMALQQADVLMLLTSVRRSNATFDKCSRIASGYNVPKAQVATEVPVPAEDILPADGVTGGDGGQSTAVGELPVVNPASPAVPAVPLEAAAVWKAAKPTLSVKAKTSISKSRLLSFVGLRAPKGSKVRIIRSARSKAVCSAYTWGVKGRKAGSCRVVITVIPKKGKAISKSVTIKIMK